MRGRGLMFIFHLEGFLRSIYEVKKIEIWLVGLVGQKMIEATSNSFYVVFGPFLAPIPNFVHIGWKAHKLKICTIRQFRLVGLVGQKMAAATSNSIYVLFGPFLAPIPNFT